MNKMERLGLLKISSPSSVEKSLESIISTLVDEVRVVFHPKITKVNRKGHKGVMAFF